MRKEGLEEQFNTMLKQGWNFAADAAIDDNRSSEGSDHAKD